MPRPKKEAPNHAGGLYEVKITVGKTLNGKLIRKSFYSSTSKEDARRQADKWKIEREVANRTNTTLVAKDPLFEEWAAIWLKTYKQGTVRDFTYRNTYVFPVTKYIIPQFGSAHLSAIRPVDVQNLYKKLSSYSKSTLSKVRLCLNSIFDAAIDNELLIKNPAKNVPLPDTKASNEKRTYTLEQADLLFDYALAHPHGIQIALLLKMGLRRSELLALQWGDFDLEGRSLTISRSTALSGGKPVIGPPKSSTSNRQLPIPCELLDAIKKNAGGPLEYVVTNSQGGIMHPDNWSSQIFGQFMDAFSAETGCPPLNPHELRHTCGTLLYEKTGNIYAVSKFLGHADISITTKIYVHNSIDTLRKDLGF